MKRLLVVFIVFVLMACSKDAEVINNGDSKIVFHGELAWIKSFGGSGEDTARAIISTTENKPLWA